MDSVSPEADRQVAELFGVFGVECKGTAIKTIVWAFIRRVAVGCIVVDECKATAAESRSAFVDV